MKLTPVSETAKAPVYGSNDAACFDLHADIQGRDIVMRSECNSEYEYKIKDRLVIPPNMRALIPTGFIFGIPTGYCMKIFSRSGMTWGFGIITLNAPAIIDSDYTKETFVVLYNTTEDNFIINQGDRIAQAELSPVTRCEFESLGIRVDGFGSTGK